MDTVPHLMYTREYAKQMEIYSLMISMLNGRKINLPKICTVQINW